MGQLRVNLCKALALAALMVSLMPAATGQTYSMKILTRSGFETGINSGGEVVGTIRKHTFTHAFLWTNTTGILDLGTIRGASSAAAINNTGQIVGWFGVPGAEEAFLWTQATGMQDLGFAGIPQAINDLGQIAGNDDGSNSHAFFWTAAAGLQDLGTLGGCCSQATGINNSGQVVGWSFTASGDQHPFLWTQAGGMTDLGFVGQASAINNTGQVVGFYYRGYMDDRAFLWTTTGGLQDLGTDNGYSSFAFSINDSGWVIGDADYFFLWSETTGLKNLSQLTSSQVLSLNANTINNAGQIATNAELLNGNSAAVLFTPIISLSAVSSPNPSHVGQEFTVTATASSIESPPPDGENINFYNGSVLLGSAPMVAGVAQFTTSSAKPGKLHIKAVYPGDVNYDPSKPGAVTQVVIK
jgi:probable HAF family extracellular repeat protein